MNRVVTCGPCRDRLQVIATATARTIRASELYRVAGIAHVKDGHQLYHSTRGIITLCSAGALTPPSYYPDPRMMR